MTDRPSLCRAALAAAVLASLAGCGTAPPPRLYTLIPIDLPGPPGPPALPMAVTIVPVHLAEYLDRDEITRWVGPNELQRDDDHHWAERLPVAMTRALAADLSILTGRDVRVLAEQPRPGPSLLITLDVQRFEIAQDGSAVLAGRWSALDANAVERAGGALAIHQPVATTARPDVAAEVAALNHCLADTAASIAQGLAAIR